MKLSRETIATPHDVGLAALAYEPTELRSTCMAVLTHGFTASKESMDLLAAYLASKGIPALTYDVRGHFLGSTGGDLTSVTQAIEDLHLAAEFVKDRFGGRKVALVGHSMGAMLSLRASSERSDVSAVASIATGPRPSRGFLSVVGKAMLEGRRAYVSGAPVEDLILQFDESTNEIPLIGVPALFIAGKQDALVTPDAVKELAERVAPQAEVVEIDANHLECPQRCRGLVGAFLQRVAGRD